ncbi:MAG: SpoVR family protein, partial [Cyanobacteria bacterium]|nr:SpoVR family protein [Cyanobacteriota bacterium]
MDNMKKVTNDVREAQVLRNLNIMVPRILAAGKRWGFDPCRAIFTLKSDQQVLDDLVYPLGVPVSRPAWWYGKAAQQSRQKGQGGHVFEFATISNPAHVVLGDTNDLVMHIHVIIHAWLGHVHLFTNNIWHNETERESCLQRFAQDETFVRKLVANTREWGWDRYEWYSDAAHALENFSGQLPTDWDSPSDRERRRELEDYLKRLEDDYVLAKTDPDKKAIEAEVRDTSRLLSCHPIKPTTDILGFLMDPENTPHLPEEARRIIDMTRFENRYSTQVVGRTKTLHEGVSHFVDRRIPHAPELDFIRLGMNNMLNAAAYDTMHDAWPIYWYSDPYALGEALIEYIDDTHSKKIGTETVTFNRLKLLTDDDIKTGNYPERIAGDIIETDEVKSVEVDKWDRSYLLEVCRTYDDQRLFYHFLDEDFFERLHKKSLGWVKKMITAINLRLKQVHWDPQFIFEGDRFPQTLQEMFQVISIWMNQIQMAQWMVWFGYGAPTFPVSQTSLWQMLQIVQTVAAYDHDKHGFKRSMLLRTGLQWLPNIK